MILGRTAKGLTAEQPVSQIRGFKRYCLRRNWTIKFTGNNSKELKKRFQALKQFLKYDMKENHFDDLTWHRHSVPSEPSVFYSKA